MINKVNVAFGAKLRLHGEGLSDVPQDSRDKWTDISKSIGNKKDTVDMYIYPVSVRESQNGNSNTVKNRGIKAITKIGRNQEKYIMNTSTNGDELKKMKSVVEEFLTNLARRY